MGGGSSDAAAVLNGLNEMWGLGLPKARLCEIAAEVGSDVPALALGGPVLMEGRGERVAPLEESPLAGFPLPEIGRLVLYTPPVPQRPSAGGVPAASGDSGGACGAQGEGLRGRVNDGIRRDGVRVEAG